MTDSKVTPIKRDDRPQGITFRYKEVSQELIHSALNKLDQFTGWKDPKDIHSFNKFKKTFEREHKKAGTRYRKLVDRHAVMTPIQKKSEITGKMEDQYDANGKAMVKPKFAPNPQTGQMDIVMKDRDAFERDAKIFHDHEFTVKVYQFSADDLLAGGLTPAELRACARMVSNIDPELLVDDDLEVTEEDIPEDLRAVLNPPEDSSGGSDSAAT